MSQCSCSPLLLLLLAAASTLGHLDQTELDSQWEEWKVTHKREYNGLGEEGIRKTVWEKNMRVIEAHNQEAALGMQSFEMAMNHLGDMTSEEVYEKMTGLIVPLDSQRNATMTFNTSVHHMPKSLDYRKKGWVTSVKNQVRHLGLITSSWRVRLRPLFRLQSLQSISVSKSISSTSLTEM